MEFPSDLYYSKDHEWIRVQGNIGTVGITDFAQGELGDIVYVDIKSLGQTIKQFELFGTVEAVKTVSDLFLPVTGRIMEVNSALETTPEAVNNDPYHTGWMVKIEISNPEELNNLMKSDAYAALVGHQ